MLKNVLLAAVLSTVTSIAMANPQVELDTTKGKILIELNSEKAPVSSANFVKLVKAKYYNGLMFHRVIDGFMIQGGWMDSTGKMAPNQPTITNESKNGLHNEKGSIAMARTNDPQSASTQFFINSVDNSSKLDYPSFDGWGYAVFGKVIKGIEVVDAIAKVKTGTGVMGMPDVPVEPVVIKTAKVVKEK